MSFNRYIHLYNHYHNKDIKYAYFQKGPWCIMSASFLPPLSTIWTDVLTKKTETLRRESPTLVPGVTSIPTQVFFMSILSHLSCNLKSFILG